MVIPVRWRGTRDARRGTRDSASTRVPSAASTSAEDAAPPVPGASAPSGGVAYFSAAALARAADALAGGARTGRTLHASAGFQYVVMRRLTSGGPEVHDDWADVTFVQAGHGSLLSGGRVTGAALTGPGERRGGTIVGGTVRAIGPGDLLMIPAGVAHQYVVARGDSLRYITVKVARQRGR